MTGAMYAAVAGLKTHMSALNVIGNNISNVNTLGYKAARYTFNEALYTTSRTGSNGTATLGGRNPAQIGYGCSVGTIDLDMSSKTYSPTGYQMDCMIDGDGFFLVGDKTGNGITTQDDLQSMNLTRLGNFEVKDGYLVDGNGQVVYGFLRVMKPTGEEGGGDDEGPVVYNGDPSTVEIAPVLTAIRIPMSRTVKLYDKYEDDGVTPSTDAQVIGNKIELYYPTVGSIAEGVGDDAKIYSAIQTTTPPVTNPDTGELIENPTAEDIEADDTVGWPALTNLAIDDTGRITGMTQDEQTVVVGYVAIAQVDSPNGVTHVDGRYYQALGGAGEVHLGTVGGAVQFTPVGEEEDEESPYSTDLPVSGAGDTELKSGGLEGSGTDLATEISNMITIQRGYQANTRIVTVTDSMLEELVNMKR